MTHSADKVPAMVAEAVAQGREQANPYRAVAQHDASLSSPACAAHQADDAYMGYLGRMELARALNELLEMQRGGACLMLRLGLMATTSAVMRQTRQIYEDKVLSCKVLMLMVYALDQEPSEQVGAVYAHAMAVTGSAGAMQVFRQEQDKLAARLAALLPVVRDDLIHEGLSLMLEAQADHH